MAYKSQSFLAAVEFYSGENRNIYSVRTESVHSAKQKVIPFSVELSRPWSKKGILGATMAGQKQFAEAEPLVDAGYEGMKRRESDPAVGPVSADGGGRTAGAAFRGAERTGGRGEV